MRAWFAIGQGNRSVLARPGNRDPWSFDDLAAITDVESRRLTFRRVRDEIASQIRLFLEAFQAK